jgi:hypothetical protein
MHTSTLGLPMLVVSTVVSHGSAEVTLEGWARTAVFGQR